MDRASMDVLVVGLGSSGDACVRHLVETVGRGELLRVTAVDSADNEELRSRASAYRQWGVTVGLGVSDVEGSWDLAILSPGIPPSAPLFEAARRSARELISEIEYAYRHSCAPWIAVTGTNGKSTVTSLIGHILAAGEAPVYVVGNIGVPATSTLLSARSDGVFVAEVSSFQLALTTRFHPRVAVLLNITADHLDWHGDMDRYIAEKARLFANLEGGDTAVVNIDDPNVSPFSRELAHRGVRVVEVSVEGVPQDGCGIDASGYIVLSKEGRPLRLLSVAELPMRGRHNASNACAAAGAAFSFGVAPEIIAARLRSFIPLQHRLATVATIDAVEYVDDSKATNPDAALKAVESFPDRQVIVLLGGRSKGASFDSLAAALHRTGARAVVFGEARHEIARALSAHNVAHAVTRDLAHAVTCAHAEASAGDVVLLAPACSSFDEFESYAQRGARFADAVSSLGDEGS